MCDKKLKITNLFLGLKKKRFCKILKQKRNWDKKKKK